MLAPSVTTTLDDLLAHVDRFGVEASASHLDRLVTLAHRHGIAPAVVELLTDADAPAVLRERALARTLADLRAMAPQLAPIAA